MQETTERTKDVWTCAGTQESKDPQPCGMCPTLQALHSLFTELDQEEEELSSFSSRLSPVE